MSNIDKQALREAAEKATALNLDTAQVKRGNDGYLECPCCEGAGYVEEEADFCNIDGVALGVQFYGIGEHHGLAEAYFRAANPATVLALLDELEAKDTRISEQADTIANQDKWIRAIEEAMITSTDRAEAAEKRIAELEAREVREEGNQFLVVRHPGKAPVIKHSAGDLEGFLRQLLEHEPMATIDIVTHRYYGVGGQWVQDADEYLHMMTAAAAKGE
ncbi:hypothetical protein CIW60_12495 [Enterobacter roggenkampii]|uniref:ead/Ea22-like family protein n=1 Tax=Enterobacter roggenkampii TaxID=1812935 RepID=UPI000BA88DA3|nr:hypothetical protein CIW60_12495 [Enterobacter roggenkampii]